MAKKKIGDRVAAVYKPKSSQQGRRKNVNCRRERIASAFIIDVRVFVLVYKKLVKSTKRY